MEKGKTANASIMIKGIGEEGLSRARITLNYDSSVVEVESVGGSEFDTFVESLEINELKDNEGRSVRFERKNGFFSITGEEKTEVLSAAIWVWGVLGVVLLIVAIARRVFAY